MKKVAWLLVVVMLFSMGSGWTRVYAEESSGTARLTVALYPYVPDIESFKQAVLTHWRAVEPNIALDFVEWDCYEEDPPEDLDVFVFDGIFLTRFIENELLLPFAADEVDNAEDIIDFALKACKSGDAYYAIPQILCTNLLYTRKSDEALLNIAKITQLYGVLGDRISSGVIPGENEGLLADMSGGTTKACLYLDALISVSQRYNNYYTLPDLEELNDEALESLRIIQRMAGVEQANYWPENNDAYIRSEWFRNGHGRAYIGYAEAMNSMADYVDELDIWAFSMSGNCDLPVMYADLIGVNANISGDKQEAAVKLANILASGEVLLSAIKPEGQENPQYLFPARYSVYLTLKQDFPIYNKLLGIAVSPKNEMFKMGANVREWLAQAKKVIPNYLLTE